MEEVGYVLLSCLLLMSLKKINYSVVPMLRQKSARLFVVMVIQLTVAENSSKSANASPNKYDIEKMVLFYAFLVLSKLV